MFAVTIFVLIISIKRLAMGYAFRGPNPGKVGPKVEPHPASRKMGTVSLFWG